MIKSTSGTNNKVPPRRTDDKKKPENGVQNNNNNTTPNTSAPEKPKTQQTESSSRTNESSNHNNSNSNNKKTEEKNSTTKLEEAKTELGKDVLQNANEEYEKEQQEETTPSIPEEVTTPKELCELFHYDSIDELKNAVEETHIIDFDKLENGGYTQKELRKVAYELNEALEKIYEEEERIKKEEEIASSDNIEDVKDTTFLETVQNAVNKGVPKELAGYFAKEAFEESLSQRRGEEVSLVLDENGDYYITKKGQEDEAVEYKDREYLYNEIYSADSNTGNIEAKYKEYLRNQEPKKYALAKTMYDNPDDASRLFLEQYGNNSAKATDALQTMIDSNQNNSYSGLFSNAKVKYDEEKGIIIETESYGDLTLSDFEERCQFEDRQNLNNYNENAFLNVILNGNSENKDTDKITSLNQLTSTNSTIADDISEGTLFAQAIKNAQTKQDAYDAITTYCGYNKEVSKAIYNYLFDETEEGSSNPYYERNITNLTDKLYTNTGNKYTLNDNFLKGLTEYEPEGYDGENNPVLRPQKEYYTNLEGEVCTRNWDYEEVEGHKIITLTLNENDSERKIKFETGENENKEQYFSVYQNGEISEDSEPIIETKEQFLKRLAIAENYSVVEAVNPDLMSDSQTMSTENIEQYYEILKTYDENISSTLLKTQTQFQKEGTIDNIRNQIVEFLDSAISDKDVLEEIKSETEHTVIMSYFLNGQDETAQELVKDELDRRLNSSDTYQDMYDVLTEYGYNKDEALEIINNEAISDSAREMYPDITFIVKDGVLFAEGKNPFTNEMQSQEAKSINVNSLFYNENPISLKDSKYAKNLSKEQAYKFLCQGGECTKENIENYKIAQDKFTDYNTAIVSKEMLEECKTPEDAFKVITGKDINDETVTDEDIKKFNGFYSIDKASWDSYVPEENQYKYYDDPLMADYGPVQYKMSLHYDKENGFQIAYKEKNNEVEYISLNGYDPNRYSLPDSLISYTNDMLIKEINTSLGFSERLSQEKFRDFYALEGNKAQIDEYINSYADYVMTLDSNSEEYKHFEKALKEKGYEDVSKDSILKYINANKYEESCNYMQYAYTSAKQALFGKSRLDETTGQYCTEMAQYSSKLSHALSKGCMITSVLFPAAAPVLMTGAKIAGYSDNAIDLINMISNRQNYLDDDYMGLAKSTGFEWITKKGYMMFSNIAGDSAQEATKWIIDNTKVGSFIGANALAQIGLKGTSEALIETGICIPWTMAIKAIQGGEYNLKEELTENFIYDFLPYARGWQDLLIGKVDNSLYAGDGTYWRLNGSDEIVQVDPDNNNKILGIYGSVDDLKNQNSPKVKYDYEDDKITVTKYASNGKVEEITVQEKGGSKITYYNPDEEGNKGEIKKTSKSEQMADGLIKITTSEPGKPDTVEIKDDKGRTLSVQKGNTTVEFDPRTSKRTSMTINGENNVVANYKTVFGGEVVEVKRGDNDVVNYKIDKNGIANAEIEGIKISLPAEKFEQAVYSLSCQNELDNVTALISGLGYKVSQNSSGDLIVNVGNETIPANNLVSLSDKGIQYYDAMGVSKIYNPEAGETDYATLKIKATAITPDGEKIEEESQVTGEKIEEIPDVSTSNTDKIAVKLQSDNPNTTVKEETVNGKTTRTTITTENSKTIKTLEQLDKSGNTKSSITTISEITENGTIEITERKVKGELKSRITTEENEINGIKTKKIIQENSSGKSTEITQTEGEKVTITNEKEAPDGSFISKSITTKYNNGTYYEYTEKFDENNNITATIRKSLVENEQGKTVLQIEKWGANGEFLGTEYDSDFEKSYDEASTKIIQNAFPEIKNMSQEEITNWAQNKMFEFFGVEKPENKTLQQWAQELINDPDYINWKMNADDFQQEGLPDSGNSILAKKINELSYMNSKLNNAVQNVAIKNKTQILSDWFEGILKNVADSNNDNLAQSYAILSQLADSVDAETAHLPKTYNEEVLNQTLDGMKVSIATNGKTPSTNIIDTYKNAMVQTKLSQFANDNFDFNTTTGWVTVPKGNPEALKVLSHDTWCTSSATSEKYSEAGDFIMYYENGRPVLGIRFENKIGTEDGVKNICQIREIQGMLNDGNIPSDKIPLVREILKDMGFDLSDLYSANADGYSLSDGNSMGLADLNRMNVISQIQKSTVKYCVDNGLISENTIQDELFSILGINKNNLETASNGSKIIPNDYIDISALGMLKEQGLYHTLLENCTYKDNTYFSSDLLNGKKLYTIQNVSGITKEIIAETDGNIISTTYKNAATEEILPAITANGIQYIVIEDKIYKVDSNNQYKNYGIYETIRNKQGELSGIKIGRSVYNLNGEHIYDKISTSIKGEKDKTIEFTVENGQIYSVTLTNGLNNEKIKYKTIGIEYVNENSKDIIRFIVQDDNNQKYLFSYTDNSFRPISESEVKQITQNENYKDTTEEKTDLESPVDYSDTNTRENGSFWDTIKRGISDIFAKPVVEELPESVDETQYDKGIVKGLSSDEAKLVASAGLDEAQEKIFNELYENRSFLNNISVEDLVKISKQDNADLMRAIEITSSAKTYETSTSLMADIYNDFEGDGRDKVLTLLIDCNTVNIEQIHKLIEFDSQRPDNLKGISLGEIAQKTVKYNTNPAIAATLAKLNLDNITEKSLYEIIGADTIPQDTKIDYTDSGVIIKEYDGENISAIKYFSENGKIETIDIDNLVQRRIEKYKNELIGLEGKEDFPKHPLTDDEILKATRISSEFYVEYLLHEKEMSDIAKGLFEGVDSIETISSRAKSENSIYAKLTKFMQKGKLNIDDPIACKEVIADAYGSRIQVSNLTEEQHREVVENYLKEFSIDCTYEDYLKLIEGTADKRVKDQLEDIRQKEILQALKEKQTDLIVDKIIENMTSDPPKITIADGKISNYGSEESTYFTPKQLERIADAYFKQTGKKLKIISVKEEGYNDNAVWTVKKSKDGDYDFCEAEKFTVESKDASKDSGYTTSQFKTIFNFADGTTGYGEIQIRGIEVNKYGDIEHIPYDYKSHKLDETDPKYAQVCKCLGSMDDESFKKYTAQMAEIYKASHKIELGYPNAGIPKLEGIFRDKQGNILDISCLSYDSLMKQFGHK